MKVVLLFLFATAALAKLLVDFSAAEGDNPSVIGLRNLEAARSVAQSNNTADLYIELGKDPRNVSAAHFHRIKGDIRAEYHALNKKTVANTTYYIGYAFSLAQIQQSLMIWQFKEYVANSHGGANIPLAMEIVNGRLEFQYQASNGTGRIAQWSTSIVANQTYRAGIVINTSTPGWVQLYWDGTLQTFNTTGSKKLIATTFPGRADPKFGAYRGEAVGIDTFVYDIRIGTQLDDIRAAAGINNLTACGFHPKPARRV
ncbi:lectin [Coleophoma cylindrospora]|uniref:Lectin n=1 Tax=Coleophoma cylindrospora TaxID=1849047 RepID=A0A3D8QNR0_9HELO|nr:lectin [Coleophoma cylindrospora]